jgi:branched-chain amino acid transport system ATP-binding protein
MKRSLNHILGGSTGLLSVEKINVGYGTIQVLWDVTFNVKQGEKVAIIGPNSAGKTTTLKAIAGLLRIKSGMIEFMGEKISGLPAHEVVKRGIVLVPEGRRLFPKMTVLENLKLGALVTPEAKAKMKDTLEWVFQLFPVLKERVNQRAETLSGGEGQILAIARGLMARPKLLMLDEPSLGLGPIVVSQIFSALEKLNGEGAILLVEQYVTKALEFSDRAYILERGKIVMEGTGEELLKNEYIKRVYVG